MRETNKSNDQLRINLEQLKSALEEPKLYIFNFLENLKAKIDIKTQQALDKQLINEEQLIKNQEIMINNIMEFQELCLSKLLEQNLSQTDLQSTIEEIESDLDNESETVDNEDIEKSISNALFDIQRILFQNKSIHYVEPGKTSYLSNRIEKHLGILILIEDDFIDTKNFDRA